MKKKIIAFLLIGLCFLLGGCSLGASPTNSPDGTVLPGDANPADLKTGQVRILNKDPQLQKTWETLAAEYSALTGVDAAVVSSEADATLLTVSGQNELPAKCVDLSGTAAYAQLASWDLTLCDTAGQVCAIAADVEVFGLVYNSTLLAQTSNTRADITGFAALTEVVYSISDNAQQLGFSAFSRFDPDGYFAMHLASLTQDPRNLVDLIISNSIGASDLPAEAATTDALQDFLNSKSVFLLAGSSEQETLNAIGSENIGVLPVYLGSENEDGQSLCTSPSSYWCIPESAGADNVQAALDFLDFLVQPRSDGTVPVDDLNRVAPYRQATYAGNMLEVVFRSDLAMGRKPMACRSILQMPDRLIWALNAYAADPSNQNWETVVALMEQG